MMHYRIAEAAALLGVSDDTVRRWIKDDLLESTHDDAGRQIVAGDVLATVAKQQGRLPGESSGVRRSARNRFVGIVTRVVSDPVMSQVEMQCGPYRIVSLMSTEAVRDLELEVGSRGVAVVKATMVIVETEGDPA